MARAATMLAILVLALPAAAAAHLRTIAPPGNPTVSQYLETVPTVKGQSPTSSLGQQGGTLSSTERQTLDQSGADGRTLESVVQATSPPPATKHRGSGRDRSGSGTGPLGSLPSAALSGQGARSPAASILDAAGGTGGMGVFLPALMITVVVGVLAGVVFRWRRSPPS